MIIIEIAGFLGADAEERFTSTGKRVIGLRVATKVRHSNQDETVWWKANIWSDRFDKMVPYLKKGAAVIIVGEMGKPEVYTARDGSQQVSLTMNAEMVKFSPFGKPQNDGPKAAPSSSENFHNHQGSNEELVAFSAPLAQESKEEEAFDDLPF